MVKVEHRLNKFRCEDMQNVEFGLHKQSEVTASIHDHYFNIFKANLFANHK